MIRIVQDLRIGTKLAIASGLCILLVGLMIFSQIAGNVSVRKANEIAIAQQAITRDAIDVKASVRGMQVGIRDALLATAPADMQKASDYIAARLKSVGGFIDEMLKLAQTAENRERIEKLRGLAGDYAKAGQQIAAIRTDLVSIGAGEPSAEMIEKLGKLSDEETRIARDVAAPLATEIGPLADKIVEYSKHQVDEENAVAAQEMASVERISLAIGFAAGLLLIGTCIFSIFTIARPMRALSVSMQELADGNFGVVLPGLGRKDEIGAVAQAVETFKVKAEQKARDEAEAKTRQDEIAAQRRKADMDQARRHLRNRRRRDRRNRVLGFDRARSLRHHAHRDRGSRAGDHHHGRGGLRGSLHQCAVGGLCDRGTDFVGQRDQPPGAGIGADGQRGGRPGPQDQ